MRKPKINIQQQLELVRPPLQSCATLPPGCYTSVEWASLEQQNLFSHAWVVVGRRDRWKQPGDFVCMDVAGAPLVVTLDHDNRLSGLSNSCRHRGMKLKSGSGNCQQLVCPFHAWTYALDGTLVSAPRMENCQQSEHGFALSDYGLPTVRVAEAAGFVFVCMDPDQCSLDDWLADFEEIHGPWNLSNLVTTRVNEFEVDCNWKTFIEVFNEYYHLPCVHPKSLNGLYHEPDEADIVMGEYATQFGVTNGTAALLEATRGDSLPPAPSLEGRNLLGTRYTWLFPNTTFAACSDSVWMYQAFPLGANRCQVVQSICFPGSSTAVDNFEDRASSYYDRIDRAISEDLPFLEAQQLGLNSPLARQGRFSALEPAVGQFACWYARRMCDPNPINDS